MTDTWTLKNDPGHGASFIFKSRDYTAQIRWDGCVNIWHEDELDPEELHVCDLKHFIEMLTALYAIGAHYFPEGQKWSDKEARKEREGK